MMNNVLNFVVQSTLSTINIGIVSIAGVAEATTLATTHAQAGIGLAKDRTRRKLVPDNIKNQALLRLSYAEHVAVLNDDRADRFDVYAGDMNYTEYREAVASRLVNMDFYGNLEVVEPTHQEKDVWHAPFAVKTA